MNGFPWEPVLALLGVTVTAAFLYLGTRFTGRQATSASRDVDSATWERRYRHGAERHLRWDVTVVTRVNVLEAAVIELLPEGHPARTLLAEPLGEPPPLFPDADPTP